MIFFAILLFAMIPLSAHAAPSWSDAPDVPWTSEADQFTATFTDLQDFANTVTPLPEIGPFRGKGKAARAAYNKLKKQNKVARERIYERKTRDLDKLYYRATEDISTNNERRQVGISTSYDTLSQWIDNAQEEDERQQAYNYANELGALEQQQNSEISSVAEANLAAVANADNLYNAEVENAKASYQGSLANCGRNPATVSPATKPAALKKKDKKNNKKKKEYNKALKTYKSYDKKQDAYDECMDKVNNAYENVVGGLDNGANSAAARRDNAIAVANVQQDAAANEITSKYGQAQRDLEFKYGGNTAVPYDTLRSQLESRVELYQFRSSRQLEEERRIAEDSFDRAKDTMQDAYDLVEDEE